MIKESLVSVRFAQHTLGQLAQPLACKRLGLGLGALGARHATLNAQPQAGMPDQGDLQPGQGDLYATADVQPTAAY